MAAAQQFPWLGSEGRALARRLMRPRIPRPLSNNFRSTTSNSLAAIESSLRERYFKRFHDDYLQTEEGKADLADHLSARVDRARMDIVPWISNKQSLAGARLLEIGSGTGASTLAFAEQGADVTALDVDAASLEVARVRCEEHGLRDVRFVVRNAEDVAQLFHDYRFDFVVFYASLEHMTYQERVHAIEKSWGILRPGGIWAIVESPNRLWHYDSHTSLLPFFHWLPDDLALSYMRFSPREKMRKRFEHEDAGSALRLARSGRGMSYHELAIALGDVSGLDVVSSLSSYRRRRNPLSFLFWLATERRFELVLRKAAPAGIANAFFHPYLDVMIRKAQ